MSFKGSDGRHAFPHQNSGYTSAYGGCPGLTKAEWFAGMALQGILANPNFNGTGDFIASCAKGYGDILAALFEADGSVEEG